MTAQVSADSIRTDLRDKLAGILYCEVADIGDDATLIELGLDSVLGLELLAVVNAEYGLKENIDSIYDHPTLTKLTDYLHERLTAPERTDP